LVRCVNCKGRPVDAETGAFKVVLEGATTVVAPEHGRTVAHA
jgi:hypothetical protein